MMAAIQALYRDDLDHGRAIRLWLYVVAALIFAMVVVGGATRLTESGLSITEWQPVTGALPPLSEAQWQMEFQKYQAIPQYRQLNAGMSLADFKTIYWWEWTHRLIGRGIGIIFFVPFVWFLWRGWIPRNRRAGLWLILALGALQGAIGWWMVASGLAGRVEVSQYRLATHLVLACLIYVAVVWTGTRWQDERAHALFEKLGKAAQPVTVRAGAIGLVVLILAQTSPPGTTSPGRRKPPEPRTSTAPEPPSALFPLHLKQVDKGANAAPGEDPRPSFCSQTFAKQERSIRADPPLSLVRGTLSNGDRIRTARAVAAMAATAGMVTAADAAGRGRSPRVHATNIGAHVAK